MYIKTTILIQTANTIRAMLKRMGSNTTANAPAAITANNAITYIIYSNSGIYSSKKKVDKNYPCKTSLKFYN